MEYVFNDSGELLAMSKEELAVADQDSSIIVKNSGTLNSGKPYWVYIAVKPSKYREFIQYTKEHRPLKLSDYGEILRHGFEEEVPVSVKEEMRQLYGCDDRFMDILAHDVNKARENFYKEQEKKRIDTIVSLLKNKTVH